MNRIEPSDVTVVLDYPIAKELPIQVDWVGKLPEGLILRSVSVEPVSLKVMGAGRILSRVSTLYTRKVHLENLQTSGRITVALALEPASLEILDKDEAEVNVRYEITKRLP